MTIAPASPKIDVRHHPRTSYQFSRDLDFLHRLSAQVPQNNAGRDINNNELGDQMEICCNAGFKPTKLGMTLNGNQLSVYGQQSDSLNNKQIHCFGETFILPENIDPSNIYCEVKRNNQLSIQMQQMAFEANGNSTLPCAEAKSAGLW